MSFNIKSITVLELRRLLIDLKAHQPNTCIRVRLLGEMWFSEFMNIILVTEKGIVLNDERFNRLRVIPLIAGIAQFEIDQRFQSFQPHFHYEVTSYDEQ